METKEFVLLTPSEMDELGIEICYLKPRCRKCGKTWGVTWEEVEDYRLTGGEKFKRSTLTCKECAVRAITGEE